MSIFNRSNRPPAPADPRPSNRILGNLPYLFGENLKLIGFFLPSLIAILCYLLFGGLVFLLVGLLFLLFAAPAVTAMYDTGYQLILEIPADERRKFLESYRLNARQSIATMAVQLPLIALPLILLGFQSQLPTAVAVSMLLGCLLTQTFGVLSFSQIALLDLPLTEIWKKSLMIIPLTGWRAICAAVVQLIFVVALIQYLPIMIVVFFLWGPGLLVCMSCKMLWPVVQTLLLEDSE